MVVFAALRFEHPTATLALAGFGGAVIGTAGIGHLIVLACAPAIARAAVQSRAKAQPS